MPRDHPLDQFRLVADAKSDVELVAFAQLVAEARLERADDFLFRAREVDLGGLDPNTGYSTFKRGLRPREYTLIGECIAFL
jgi:hypothetical protein